MTTIAELLDASRIFELRKAVAATLKPLFAGVGVVELPGRLDAEDVIGDRSPFQPPQLAVGVIRIDRAERRMSGTRDVPVEIGIYPVAGDLDVPGRGLVTRDELALALVDGVLAVLERPDLARWGLADIGQPEDVMALPLFAAKTSDKGTVFWGITLRQVLYAEGHPFLDMDSSVDGDQAVTVHLPGDPGWLPPPPPLGGTL